MGRQPYSPEVNNCAFPQSPEKRISGIQTSYLVLMFYGSVPLFINVLFYSISF